MLGHKLSHAMYERINKLIQILPYSCTRVFERPVNCLNLGFLLFVLFFPSQMLLSGRRERNMVEVEENFLLRDGLNLKTKKLPKL